MVYVVAAYSITISVLLIYGILLKHRARLADPQRAGGFDLGAALLAPLWALGHGQHAAGALLVVATIALVVAQAMGQELAASVLASLLVGGALFFGVVGNRLTSGADPVARVRAELRWALAGAVVHTIVLPWACYFWLARG